MLLSQIIITVSLKKNKMVAYMKSDISELLFTELVLIEQSNNTKDLYFTS